MHICIMKEEFKNIELQEYSLFSISEYISFIYHDINNFIHVFNLIEKFNIHFHTHNHKIEHL